jgi:hypothetical protein
MLGLVTASQIAFASAGHSSVAWRALLCQPSARARSAPAFAINYDGNLAKTVDQPDRHYSVVVAILVNAPTLGGWYLLQRQAVAISRTTGIHAFLFSDLGRRKGERGEIGVTRMKCSGTQ